MTPAHLNLKVYYENTLGERDDQGNILLSKQ